MNKGQDSSPDSALPITEKNFNVKLFANAADANANAGGSIIALPGLRPGELKMIMDLNDKVGN